MRVEYINWLRRDRFQKLSRNSHIVHAAVCGDVDPADLVIALGERIAELEAANLSLMRRVPAPPFFHQSAETERMGREPRLASIAEVCGPAQEVQNGK